MMPYKDRQKVRKQNMSCKECKHSPKTYEEYCIGQRNPSAYCPDAYTEKAQYCGNYDKSNAENEVQE